MGREIPTFFRRDYVTKSPAEPIPSAAEPPPVVVASEALSVDDFLDFPVVDDDLKVEDIVPGLEPPRADRLAELAEFDACVQTALAALPRAWRLVLELRFVDDLGFSEVSRRTGVPEEEISTVLEHARALLRAHLEEAGCRFTS